MPSLYALLSGTALGLVLYVPLRMLYNITFYPLAKFPGPRLAAATHLYEIYYEVFLGGKLSDQIFELHQRYGPIIRVTPCEAKVHILDSSNYDSLFNFNPELGKRRRTFDNLHETPTFEMHRKRRRAFDSYYSRTSIFRLESVITILVQKMCTQICEVKGTGTPLNMSTMYRCLTTDIISDYCFSQSYNMLDDPQGNEKFVVAFVGIFKMLFLMRESRWTAWLIQSMSVLRKWLVPTDELRDVKAAKKQVSRASVFEQYIHNEDVPSDEKSDKILLDYALLFVSAGLETTGFACATATYHILDSPTIYQTLKAEIGSVWPKEGHMPPLTTLEKLPYLTACLKESLRLSIGVMSRFHRINHHRPIVYKDWTIDPGWSVSMSQCFVLYDEDIFPEAKTFRPERWLKGEQCKALDKWFVVFSRGARSCIGQNLAWAEMYIAIASVVHSFDMSLHDTDKRHVDPKYDYFVPFPEVESGVRVTVK
ncbi:hypothetical protein LTR56_009814 [Elasticomyces elasticus]|nr:hypothetical protein LTR56_009814 [Elasticomyces elasticus]KAK3659129.1 hypothetical protein LTR22_008592 [Elasticomyces elasticus]KAK4923193.1 hypothetical protein LTR49_009661 [Elasticomyces elasticus]KAK5761577.1 hypothetical protein LTS12_008369 [Elasticomyces elasticus]